MFLNDAYLPEEELCIAEVFSDNGYSTGYIGKWHLDGQGRFDFTPRERRQGFDYWKALECSHDYNNMAYYEGDSPEMKYWEGYSPFAIAEDASSYISTEAAKENPFFLFVALATPHFPHASAPQEFKDLYPESELILAPNVPEEMYPAVKEEMVGYYAHCTATDKAIGDILQTLEELDLMDETLIVFTSDHGESLGAHGVRIKQKQVPWFEIAGVPLIVSYPAKKGIKTGALKMSVTTPDISSTLLELSGLKVPKSFEGESFADAIIKGIDDEENGALYMAVAPFASVRKEYKREYRALKTAKYTYAKDLDGPWLLYDDEKDPHQLTNLVQNKDYTDILTDLDKQLMDELERVKDDFRPGASHIEEWGFTVLPAGHIPYKAFDQKPQSPKRNTSNK
jgi:arylsulfatase A-like enzyme